MPVAAISTPAHPPAAQSVRPADNFADWLNLPGPTACCTSTEVTGGSNRQGEAPHGPFTPHTKTPHTPGPHATDQRHAGNADPAQPGNLGPQPPTQAVPVTHHATLEDIVRPAPGPDPSIGPRAGPASAEPASKNQRGDTVLGPQQDATLPGGNDLVSSTHIADPAGQSLSAGATADDGTNAATEAGTAIAVGKTGRIHGIAGSAAGAQRPRTPEAGSAPAGPADPWSASSIATTKDASVPPPGTTEAIQVSQAHTVGQTAAPSRTSSPEVVAVAQPPATQLGPAIAALSHSSDGGKHVTIRLDPAELGLLQVRITRAQDGTATVSVSVERVETLHSLQTDLSHLHQALDRAGLPPDRHLSLHLAPPETWVGSQNGQTGSQQSPHQQQARQSRSATSGPGSTASDFPPSGPVAPATWLRAGINITA